MSATRPVRPAERYGDRPGNKRLAAAAMVVIAVIAVAGVLWLAWQHSTHGVSGEVTRYRVTSVHAVSVTVVFQRAGAASAQCTVRALAEDHSVVGERVLVLPRGAARTTVTQVVRTSRLATSADVVDCKRH